MAKPLYKVMFHSQGKVYEIYAGEVASSGLYGFIQVGDLVFGDGGMVVDPAEEKLREMFKGVRRFHVPMHGVVRVEEVDKRGACKIRDAETGDTVTPFPLPRKPLKQES